MMGARDFSVVGRGKTAMEAFNDAVREAKYQHGHGGYTGTIAEKSGYRVFQLPEGMKPQELLRMVMNDEIPDDAPRSLKMIEDIALDKWGPAVCIHLGSDKYWFFGLASS